MKKNAIIIGEEDITDIQNRFPEADLRLFRVQDWNSELSPWSAPAVFKGQDFAGNGDETIERLKPLINEDTYLIGYSLAGLFALYAATKVPVKGVASVSGSLWYPGFLEYLKEHPVQTGHVYLSLGDKEKHSKNPLMATVEDCTKEASKIIGAYADTVFEMNEGNHFQNAEERIIKALNSLLG